MQEQPAQSQISYLTTLEYHIRMMNEYTLSDYTRKRVQDERSGGGLATNVNCITRELIIHSVDKALESGPVLTNTLVYNKGEQVYVIYIKEDGSFLRDQHDKLDPSLPTFSFYLEFYLSYCFIPKYENEKPCLKLFSVFIPPHLRRQGIFTEILQKLKNESFKQGRIFIVGPVMNTIVDEMLQKSFTRRSFMDYYIEYDDDDDDDVEAVHMVNK